MQISYDIHCHTHLSECGDASAVIPYYVQTAKELGLSAIGIADHLWDSAIAFPEQMRHARNAGDGNDTQDWYRPQNVEHCKRILQEIADTDTQGIRFLSGAEVEYCPGRGPAVLEENAEKLDFIIVPNSHTHIMMDKALYMPYEKHGEFMLKAAMEICTLPMCKYVTALAHPFAAVCCPYPVDDIIDTITDAQLCEVFSAAREADIAAEINLGVFARTEVSQMHNHFMIRVLQMAKKCGCKFTFGSDSHAAGSHTAYVEKAQMAAKLLHLTDADILKI